MLKQILTTKIYMSAPRSNIVPRARLINHLNTGLRGKLTLVSAPAGFGKSTLVTEWITAINRPAAWLSLDEDDSDPIRFLSYVIATLQTVAPDIGASILNSLESAQSSSITTLLTALLNELVMMPDDVLLVLDDYHMLVSTEIDGALAFLIDNLPPKIHLVIITREDPQLPLARYRARAELTELRVADLRFTTNEATQFLSQTMGLTLSKDAIKTLETRTEGWIAGLQLAALSLQGHSDKTQFIESFSGSNQYILDYLLEEVMQQQPEDVQTFLLCTSILDRLCGSLCDAIIPDSSHSGQEKLEYLARTNLFLIPCQ